MLSSWKSASDEKPPGPAAIYIYEYMTDPILSLSTEDISEVFITP
jgi:hypothetical protein